MTKDTNKEWHERMFDNFLFILNEEAFISSTDSITGKVTEFADAVQDMEAVIRISGEYDTEALKSAVSKFIDQARAEERAAVKEAEARGAQEERQFILNVLDGIDAANYQMQLPHDTKAIRFALQSRTISSLPENE